MGTKARVLAVALVLLVACSTPIPAFAHEHNTRIFESSIARGTAYLAAGYNPRMGLIPETPRSSTYWLLSDNFLAARVLTEYSQGNATFQALAANLTSSVIKDSARVGMRNQYQDLVAGPCQISASENYNLYQLDGNSIKTTLNNGTYVFQPAAYADIAFLESICLALAGSSRQALTVYDIGAAMFDGVGFEDAPYHATCEQSQCQYQTFKLALYIIASVQLGQPVAGTAVSNLLAMQDKNGGFRTGYDASLSPMDTLTNTETTSLAVLALGAYLDR